MLQLLHHNADFTIFGLFPLQCPILTSVRTCSISLEGVWGKVDNCYTYKLWAEVAGCVLVGRQQRGEAMIGNYISNTFIKMLKDNISFFFKVSKYKVFWEKFQYLFILIISVYSFGCSTIIIYQLRMSIKFVDDLSSTTP